MTVRRWVASTSPYGLYQVVSDKWYPEGTCSSLCSLPTRLLPYW